jgi:hypothetical protein
MTFVDKATVWAIAVLFVAFVENCSSLIHAVDEAGGIRQVLTQFSTQSDNQE